MKGNLILSIPFYWKLTCHTCRAAKREFEGRNIDIKPIDIIKNPPSKRVFRSLIKRYGAEGMIRKNSSEYKELGGSKIKSLASEDLSALFVLHPDLASRPIVLVGESAYLSRDPEIAELLFRGS